jgi:hypothetical protein
MFRTPRKFLQLGFLWSILGKVDNAVAQNPYHIQPFRFSGTLIFYISKEEKIRNYKERSINCGG